MPLIQQRDGDALAAPKRGLAPHILSIRESRWKSSTGRGLTSASLFSVPFRRAQSYTSTAAKPVSHPWEALTEPGLP